jgi:VCBS repeat protein
MSFLAGAAPRQTGALRTLVLLLILAAGSASGAFAQLNFTNARHDLPVGATPRSVVSADLNGDGLKDLIVAAGSSNAISILLNNGNGVFRPASQVATGDSPNAAVVSKMSGDTSLIMAVACFVSDQLQIFLGNGAGGFGAPTNMFMGLGTHPAALAVIDWNRDNKTDLVVILNGTNEVRLYTGNGLGGFTIASGATFFVPVISPVAVTVGDWDQDGNQDVAVACEGDTSTDPPGNGAVTVAYGCPTGLCFPATTTVYAAPEGVVSGLFNNDIYPDLVVGSSAGNNVAILYGDPDFGFTSVTPLAVNGGSFGLAVGDFNGDTKADLAVGEDLATTGSPVVSIFNGNGFGTFTAGPVLPVGSTPADIAAVDFAGSTALDLATANTVAASVSLLVGNGSGGFTATPAVAEPAGSLLGGLVSADMNADGKLDLGITRDDVNAVDLLTGSGTGTFTSWQSLVLPGNQPGDAQAGTVLFDRFTSDGNPDLAVLIGGTDGVSVFPGNGAGVFGARVDYSLGTSCSPSTGNGCLDPQHMVAGPLNDTDTTHPDVVVTLLGADNPFPYGSISVLLQSGSGFGSATRYTGGAGPICNGGVTPGSACTLNTDCKGRCSVTSSTLCSADGDCPNGETCTNPSPGTCAINPTGVAVGLVNADTNRDLIVTGDTNNKAMYLPGNGTGAFSTVGSSATTGLQPQWPILKDLDGDGDQDLVVVNGFDSTVSTFLGDNAGNFTPLTQTGSGPDPSRGVLADLNLDGYDDLVVNNYSANSVAILLGDGTGHFGLPVRLGVGDGPITINVADYNGDGRPDLACANQADGTVSLLMNVSTDVQCSLTQAGNVTSVTWTPMYEAGRYDVIRGLVSNLTQTTNTVNLGAVTCVENDSPDSLSTDAASIPPLGTLYFYLMRGQDQNVKGSYGRSTLNKVRVAASGDCL